MGMFAVLAALVGCLAPQASAQSAGCSDETGAGGDWPMYGHDDANTRSQPLEHGIGPAQVSSLARSWSFSTGRPSGLPALNFSEFNSTPIVAGSCVYVAASYSRPAGATGDNVYALDADTGRVVWSRYAGTDPQGTAGPIIGAPLVTGNALLLLVNQAGDGARKGPYVVAYDRRNGRPLWTSPPIVTTKDYYTNATLALGHGLAIAGFSAPEGVIDGQGGVALLDTKTGALLRPPTYSIPRADWLGPDKQPRYGGAGVWTRPAVDNGHGYAYFGTGNPYSKAQVHPRTNAILKLDIDRRRSTFGEIVGDYSGNLEQYVNGAGNTVETLTKDTTCPLTQKSPVQDVPPIDPREALAQMFLNNSPLCGQQDLDYGAAPNLFTDGTGRLVVGELQKSGVYHALSTAGMTDFQRSNGEPVPSTTRPLWLSELGHSCAGCNASSSAYDVWTGRLFVASAPGAFMNAVSTRGDGPTRSALWSTPIGGGLHYQSVSVANGVVYTVDNSGFLDGYDGSDGTLILHHQLAQDIADTTATDGTNGDVIAVSSAGVAIAHHAVYVANGSHVLAYRVAR